MRKRIQSAVMVLVAVVMSALPAFAHGQTVLDKDDSDGPLDLVAAEQRHQSGDVKGLKLRLVTYEVWDSATLGGGHQFVSFEFNLDADPAIERCLVITNQEVEPGAFALRGHIYKNCKYFNDEQIGSTSLVSRPDQHSVRVSIPRKAMLPRSADVYKWRAVSSFEEDDPQSACPSPQPHGDGGYGVCSDFTAWQRHRN